MKTFDTYNQSCSPEKEMVVSPNHYALIDNIEAIHIIRASLSDEGWKGFCLGNIIKYKLRVGGKDSIEQELAKVEQYKKLYEELK